MTDRLPPDPLPRTMDRRRFGGHMVMQLAGLLSLGSLPWVLPASQARAEPQRKPVSGRPGSHRKERFVSTPAQSKSMGVVILVKAGADHLAQALAACTKGAHLSLEAGEHAGDLTIDKSVTLAGAAGAEAVVIRGSGRGPVLRIDEDGLAVRLQDVTLAGGVAEAGGGLAVFGRGTVSVSGCIFSGNQAGMLGGGGVYARAGFLQMEGCRLTGNSGRQGGAIMLDMAMKAELLRCRVEDNRAEIAGALRVAEGVDASIKGSTFKGNLGQDGCCLKASGTRSRQPKLVLELCDVDQGTLVNGPEIPAQITLKNCKVPASWKTVTSVTDGGGNTWKNQKPAQ